MFSLEPQDVVLVRVAGDEKPVVLPVNKCDTKSYISAQKKNTALMQILVKGAGIENAKNIKQCLPSINIFEKLKSLKDDQYARALQQGPKKRSRTFKAFQLQLPETCVIEAPAIGNMESMFMRVRLSNLLVPNSQL